MSTTPGNASLEVVRGSTWEQSFEYAQSDGSPVDLTGYKARMQVRTLDGQYGTSGVDTLMLELTSDNGLLVIDTPDGGTVPNRVRIIATPDEHAALNPDNSARERYGYSIELYIPASGDSAEYVVPFLVGSITVYGEVTR